MRPASWDMLMAALAAAHGALLLTVPSAPLIALGIWWNSNTISHNFIHRPFFQSKWANSMFSLWLSVLLGYPQSLWRDRHLAHHAGTDPAVRLTSGLMIQMLSILVVWIALAVRDPQFLVWQYVPGWMCGLALCAIHGHYEHARGVTSHYGKLYNTLCFNDGYHIEHHTWPGLHWTRLNETRARGETSNWPAPLRCLEPLAPELLEWMERIVLRSAMLERWVLRVHRQAFRRVLARIPSPGSVAIIGGGLFPRTALILRELLPDARLTIIDANPEHLRKAETRITGAAFVEARYRGEHDGSFDLVVIPLSFRGDRDALYRNPPAPSVIIHDWLWRSRGFSVCVSPALFKRLNVCGARTRACRVETHLDTCSNRDQCA